jgi:hypothetical protein
VHLDEQADLSGGEIDLESSYRRVQEERQS